MKKTGDKQKINNKMADSYPVKPIIILNINSLNKHSNSKAEITRMEKQVRYN